MDSSMFSRSLRIGAVLLTLVQLGVWGFYAPAHRLRCHSHLSASRSEPATQCHSRCCSHHHSPQFPADDQSANPSDHSGDQCPDDERDCDLCVIALQAGCTADVVRLSETLDRVAMFIEHAEPSASHPAAHPFDPRGPPSV